MATWQVNKAKARFSELPEKAAREGPQIIAKRGTERVPSCCRSMSINAWWRQGPTSEPTLGGPKVDDFEIERSKDRGRAIDL